MKCLKIFEECGSFFFFIITESPTTSYYTILGSKDNGRVNSVKTPIKFRQIAYCSFISIKHTFLIAKELSELIACTNEGVLNAIVTAVCSLSQFYWCSKSCILSCYTVLFICDSQVTI